MIFRKMVVSDIEALKKIYSKSFGNAIDNVSYADNIYVVEINSAVVGMCMIDYINHIFSGDKHVYINDICVSIDYRRRGVASFMLSEVIKLSKDNGASSIMLTSSNDRKDAISLYEKFGFLKRDTNVFKKKISD